MNGNYENNNEGLNAVSLGSIDNSNQNLNVPINDIPPVTPIPEEDSMEVLDDVPSVTPEVLNNEAVIDNPTQVEPDINAIPEVPPLEPVAPVNYEIPEVIDNAPVFNDIGTVPPISDIPIVNNIAEPAEPIKPKKKGMNKTLFVVLIILALCAVGGGVYVLLNKANKLPVQTKLVKIEAGSSVSTDIDDYAIFNNIDSSVCNFDTSEITDTNTIGAKYRFRITCGDKSYWGNATIVDTTKPDVTLKEVNASVNEEITAEDFIAECKDFSKCSYAFKDEAKLKEYLSTPSSYHVPIIVKDESGNEVEVTGTLIVNENSVSTMSLKCSKSNDKYEELNKFGLNEEDNTFNKSTKREYTFKFESKDEYEKLRDENKDKSEITYLDITGAPSFDDEDLILTLTKKIAYSDLVTEIGSEVPTSYGELKQFFESKDYTCSLGYY